MFVFIHSTMSLTNSMPKQMVHTKRTKWQMDD